MLSDFVYRFRALFRRGRVEAEMNDESRFHFEQEVDKNERSGLPHEEALRRARLGFGGMELTKEECREARGISFVEATIQDLQHGFRLLRHRPGLATVAVLTLTLGIGATSAIFSVTDAVLIRPLPFGDPGRLAALFQTPGHSEGIMGWAVTGPDFLDWKRQSHSFSGLAAALQDAANIGRSGAEPEFVHGQKVIPNYFDLLGVHASLGRTFGNSVRQAGREHVVLWQRIFGVIQGR